MRVQERERISWPEVYRHPLFSHLSNPPHSPSSAPQPVKLLKKKPQTKSQNHYKDEHFDNSTEDASTKSKRGNRKTSVAEENGRITREIIEVKPREILVKKQSEIPLEKLKERSKIPEQKYQPEIKIPVEKSKENFSGNKQEINAERIPKEMRIMDGINKIIEINNRKPDSEMDEEDEEGIIEERKKDLEFEEINGYILELLKFLRFLNSVRDLSNEVTVLSRKSKIKLQFIIAKKSLMIAAVLGNMKEKGLNPFNLENWEEFLQSNLFRKTAEFFNDIIESALRNYKFFLEGDTEWMGGSLRKILDFDEKNMQEFCVLEKSVLASTIIETIHFLNVQLHRNVNEKEEQFIVNAKFLSILIKSYKICIIMKLDNSFWTIFKGFGFDRTAKFLKSALEDPLKKYKEWREEFYDLHK